MAKTLRYKTEAEYSAKILLVDEALDRVLLLGEENENDSGGSSRKMRDTRLAELNDYMEILVNEREILTGGANPVVLTPGW